MTMMGLKTKVSKASCMNRTFNWLMNDFIEDEDDDGDGIDDDEEDEDSDGIPNKGKSGF